MNLPPVVALFVVAVGQAAPAPDLEKLGDPAARLEFMRKSFEVFDVHSADRAAIAYRLRPEPILRFSNPVGGAKDGAVFLWLDDRGRPGVAAQVFRSQEGEWRQEFASLSTTPMVAAARSAGDWAPARAGIELRPVPEAPRPAATAEQRLVQMRSLARDFAAQDNFRRRGWTALRLLPKPFARYGKPDSDVIDGALSAFVLTTDPEVLLVLEARPVAGGAEWQYAFAPMTTFAVKATWKGREVWSLPERFAAAEDAGAAFHIRAIPPPDQPQGTP